MGTHDEAMEEGSSDRDFRELKNVTDAFVRAICTNDASRIAEFLSEDWVLVTPEVGPIAREQFLGAIKDGRLRHDTMEIDVVRVRIYGDTALVTGRGRNTGTFNGAPIQADEWTTDVYQKSGARWRCVLTQLTPVSTAECREQD